MLLNKILTDVCKKSSKGNLFIDISNIDYDSRNIEQNGLFICIRGEVSNGHNFIEDAIENGAKAFIIEEDIDYIDGYTYIKVENSRKAMAKIASNFYNNASKDIEIIGVTGTNGKTSVTTILSQILNSYNKCGLIGTIKIDDGKDEIISKNTTPESLDIQRSLFNMIENKCDYCAMEVSSHSLALNRVEGINIDIGIFTNLSEDHLDFHKNFDNYRDVKEMLFYKTKKANIINIDDESGKIILNNIKKLDTPLYTYSLENKADFMAKDIVYNINEVSYRLITPTYEDYIRVPIPGKFTVYNTLAAISACYIFNIPIEIIKKELEQSIGVEGRVEVVRNDKDLNIIVDYAHTPDALEKILISIKNFVSGKVIVVFGCGGDRDSKKRPMMGKVAQLNSDIVIITTDNPRTENPDDIIDDILLGMNKEINNYIVVKDRKEAIKNAIMMANRDDIVLIAGKGHETYQIIGRVKYDFDDRIIAKEIADNI